MSGKVGNNPYRASGVVACAAGGGGAIDWCTTAKTSPLTADAGSGYFVNTTCGAITLTLPSSPTAGDMVGMKDYAGSWDTNSLTLGRGGSKINATCCDATFTTQGQAITMIYVDGTRGWQDVNDSTSDVTGGSFVEASGGCESTSGDYKIHKFLASATLCVSAITACAPLNVVSYMVVAGGGGGGSDHGGGGGAGGFREGTDPGDPYSPAKSPLSAACSALTVAVQGYPITVGCGGAKGATPNNPGSKGSDSVFATITSTGGGLGAAQPGTAGAGGSGGGATYINSTGAAGNSPPTTPAQGTPGGNAQPSSPYAPGGGGGATITGGTGTGSIAGPGGAGATTSITGSPVAYAGGGGGGHQGYTTNAGGCGGAGGGGDGSQGPGIAGINGTANLGGGGGGGRASPSADGGAGGRGVVIVRYKFQ